MSLGRSFLRGFFTYVVGCYFVRDVFAPSFVRSVVRYAAMYLCMCTRLYFSRSLCIGVCSYVCIDFFRS